MFLLGGPSSPSIFLNSNLGEPGGGELLKVGKIYSLIDFGRVF